MDKFVKISMVVSALLAGIGVFYYFVIFLPDLERGKVAAAERERVAAAELNKAAVAERERIAAIELDKAAVAEQEKAAVAERAKLQRQQRYEDCIAVASTNYSRNWAAACKRASQVRYAQYKDCFANGMDAAYCKRVYGDYDSDTSPECSLPKELANDVNATRTRERQECGVKAQLGIQ